MTDDASRRREGSTRPKARSAPTDSPGERRQKRADRVAPTSTATTEMPSYDAAAVGRVAGRVQILAVDLVASHFDRSEAGPLPGVAMASQAPEIGIDAAWELSEDTQILGCLLTFGTLFDSTDPAPYGLMARFRLVYSVSPGEPLQSADLENFTFWNAVFHGWPYWREYLSSTINRAHLPQFVVPVMLMPRAGD